MDDAVSQAASARDRAGHLKTHVCEPPRTLRQVADKLLLVTLVLYLTIFGYVVQRAISVRTLEPYGVSLPIYTVLLIVSETILGATTILIFASERSVWPPYAQRAIDHLRPSKPLEWPAGILLALRSAWNLSLLDLRFSSRRSISLLRLNRIFAALPLAYVLLAGAYRLPGLGLWLISSEIALTLALWAAAEAWLVDHRHRLYRTISSFFRKSRAFFRASTVTVRPARPGEGNAIAYIEMEAWGPKHVPSVTTYENRIAAWSEGVLVAVDKAGRHLGVVMATPCDADSILREAVNFDRIAALFGADQNACDLWGITLSVPARHAQTAAGTALALALYKMSLRRFRSFWLGSRLPDYLDVCGQLERVGAKRPQPEIYAKLTVAETRALLGNEAWSAQRAGWELVDSELEYYRKLDFKQVKVEQNYYPRDVPPTGVILFRRNPLYVLPRPLRVVLVKVVGELYSRFTLYKES